MPSAPLSTDLQSLCELGQQQLIDTQYLAAESTLLHAESLALAAADFDTLARLYLPLQEARRQRRQRCGEGVVHLNLLAEGPNDQLTARHVLENFPHGQLLVAGWGTLEPARQLRQMQADLGLYVETFLAAVYPVNGTGRAVVVAPLDDVALPPPHDRPLDHLLRLLPTHCAVFNADELPQEPVRGTVDTYAHVMSMWEKLHAPFLAAADMTADPLQKIHAYRRTLRVDYAAELAHQHLATTARNLAHSRPSPA